MTTDAPPPPQATMADWLALHGLTAEQCVTLLDRASRAHGPGQPAETLTAGAIVLDPMQVWLACGPVAQAHLPQTEHVIARLLEMVRITFGARPFRYEHGFTLHDDGQGLPYVFVPWGGRAGDVLATAHEFGHALQILACDGRPMPPATREICAMLMEGWFAKAARADPQEILPDLCPLVAARAFHLLGSEADKLQIALKDLITPYEYRWNYPLAQAAISLLPPDAPMGGLFSGQITLSTLIGVDQA